MPGVGAKSAERFAFHMLNWPPERLRAFADVVKGVPDLLFHCDNCGCLTDIETQPCRWCDPKSRDSRVMAVIATPKDAFALEETASYRGHYHVLGGTLSPIDGRGPEALRLEPLKARLEALQTEELIIALDSTIEGDATSLYLKQVLAAPGRRLSRLAFGIPMGSALDYVDGGTLARALSGRNVL